MENLSKSSILLTHLLSVEDPRPGRNIRHNFTEILFIAVCAALTGCESWYQIEDFAEAQKKWFRSFLTLKNGTPSHDTFRRVFTLLNFKVFQKAFTSWTQEIKTNLNITEQDQICIDGKVLRGSLCKAKSMKALHMVNAWSKKAGLNLGQVCVDKKSNEITAIPKLLSFLNIKGCLVSIDAMGCQRDIAKEIVDRGGDFLLALKGNQEGLLEATEEVFRRSSTKKEQPVTKNRYSETEKSHGRKVTRVCTVLSLNKDEEIEFFPHLKWPLIESLIRVKRETIKISTGKMTTETQYYISSQKSSAAFFNESVRSHWEVENKLHWSLDVSMGEDRDKKWFAESGKNFGLLRQFALNMLKKFPDKKKRSINRKKTMAAIDTHYLLKLWLQ